MKAIDHHQQPLELSFTMSILFKFLIHDFDSYVVYEGNEAIQVQHILLHSMAAISYSTARGIFYTRTLGTSMEGVILPVIQPDTLLKNN